MIILLAYIIRLSHEHISDDINISIIKVSIVMNCTFKFENKQFLKIISQYSFINFHYLAFYVVHITQWMEMEQAIK